MCYFLISFDTEEKFVLGTFKRGSVTPPQPEPSSQSCRKPSTHHLKVSAHEAAEILLVPAIELRKETKPKPKIVTQARPGFSSKWERKCNDRKCHRELEA